jgi:hypothetical protein
MRHTIDTYSHAHHHTAGEQPHTHTHTNTKNGLRVNQSIVAAAVEILQVLQFTLSFWLGSKDILTISFIYTYHAISISDSVSVSVSSSPRLPVCDEWIQGCFPQRNHLLPPILLRNIYNRLAFLPGGSAAYDPKH